MNLPYLNSKSWVSYSDFSFWAVAEFVIQRALSEDYDAKVPYESCYFSNDDFNGYDKLLSVYVLSFPHEHSDIFSI